MLKYWQQYIEKTSKKGEKILSSILTTTKPKLSDYEIQLVFPNKVMKAEVEKASLKIIKYLRKKLNNYQISFKLILNEAIEDKFAYTSQEKYDKLKEINPEISRLRNTFHLDL